MNKGDKQQAGRKDMHDDTTSRERMDKTDKMGGQRSRHQQAEDMGARQQGGWESDMDPQSGRKPAAERDRDYDPDGDRMGKGGKDDPMSR